MSSIMATTMLADGAAKTSSRRSKAAPKLKESCDCCARAKVRCSRERPSCLRCQSKGIYCEYSFSRRAGRKNMNSAARSNAVSSESDYPKSPQTSPTKSHSAQMQQITPSAFSSTCNTPSYMRDMHHVVPLVDRARTPHFPLAEPFHHDDSLSMWSQPPFIVPLNDFNVGWMPLTPTFPGSPSSHFLPHHPVVDHLPPPSATTSLPSSSSDPSQSTPSDKDDCLLDHHVSAGLDSSSALRMLDDFSSHCAAPPPPPHPHGPHPGVGVGGVGGEGTNLSGILPPLPGGGGHHNHQQHQHPQLHNNNNHHHQPHREDTFHFSETEAIREELCLVANFVGTLEERVNRNVRSAGLQRKAAAAAAKNLHGGGGSSSSCSVRDLSSLSASASAGDLSSSSVAAAAAGEDMAAAGCGDEDDDDHQHRGDGDDEDDEDDVDEEELDAGHDAAELKRRLSGIRQEIECIVGYG